MFSVPSGRAANPPLSLTAASLLHFTYVRPERQSRLSVHAAGRCQAPNARARSRRNGSNGASEAFALWSATKSVSRGRMRGGCGWVLRRGRWRGYEACEQNHKDCPRNHECHQPHALPNLGTVRNHDPLWARHPVQDERDCGRSKVGDQELHVCGPEHSPSLSEAIGVPAPTIGEARHRGRRSATGSRAPREPGAGPGRDHAPNNDLGRENGRGRSVSSRRGYTLKARPTRSLTAAWHASATKATSLSSIAPTTSSSASIRQPHRLTRRCRLDCRDNKSGARSYERRR